MLVCSPSGLIFPLQRYMLVFPICAHSASLSNGEIKIKQIIAYFICSIKCADNNHQYFSYHLQCSIFNTFPKNVRWGKQSGNKPESARPFSFRQLSLSTGLKSCTCDLLLGYLWLSSETQNFSRNEEAVLKQRRPLHLP